MAPGNTLALMSGGLKTLSTKFTGVSNSSQKPPGAPQEPVGGGEAGGGGSYTGPGAAGATENQTERVARESSAADAIAAVEAVTAHGAGRATGFDRYGRPVDGAGAHVGGGDVDINTINDIIANLEGGGRAAGAGQAGQAGGLHVPTQMTSNDRVQVSAAGGGGSSLGLEPRAAMLPADDDARCEYANLGAAVRPGLLAALFLWQQTAQQMRLPLPVCGVLLVDDLCQMLQWQQQWRPPSRKQGQEAPKRPARLRRAHPHLWAWD